MKEKKSSLMTALEWVVSIDVPKLKASLKEELKRNPQLDREEVVNQTFTKARWKATFSGVSTGIASNPFIALPSATVDIIMTLRAEIYATAKVALLYDKDFFDNKDSKWELLIPVFGVKTESQLQKGDPEGREGGKLTRAALKKYLSKESLIQFQILMVKFLGKRLTQRSIYTKTLPLLGGFIGGMWNWVEVSKLKTRAINYFSEREMEGGRYVSKGK